MGFERMGCVVKGLFHPWASKAHNVNAVGASKFIGGVILAAVGACGLNKLITACRVWPLIIVREHPRDLFFRLKVTDIFCVFEKFGLRIDIALELHFHRRADFQRRFAFHAKRIPVPIFRHVD